MENMPLTRPRFSEESGLQVYTHFVEIHFQVTRHNNNPTLIIMSLQSSEL